MAEEVGLEYASLEEADEVLSIVQSIVDSKGTAARTLYPRYQQIVGGAVAAVQGWVTCRCTACWKERGGQGTMQWP